jgi:hypothetical protein
MSYSQNSTRRQPLKEQIGAREDLSEEPLKVANDMLVSTIPYAS